MEKREHETGIKGRAACAVARIALLLAFAGSARAEMPNLEEFLRGAEAAGRATVALRAQGQLEVASPDATRHDEVALVVRPPTDTFIQLHQEAIKAVLLGTDAFRVKAGAATAEKFPNDASLADSDFTREDLEPFRVAHYKDARISDDSATELTVTLFPRDSQYSLMVITFDRDKKVPIKTLYYRDTLNNLVKMQRDGDYVQVGHNWRPTMMSMETFKLRTRTTVHVEWREDAAVPAKLFDPASLTLPSVSLWPAQP